MSHKSSTQLYGVDHICDPVLCAFRNAETCMEAMMLDDDFVQAQRHIPLPSTSVPRE